MRFTPPFAGLLIGTAALMGFPALAQTEPGDDSELRYGVALYHYYQQDYLEALSELMLAESRGGITDQGTNPQLVEGGIRLAFGMPESAGTLFEQALDDQRTPAQREAAWFYLGKLHYLRGDWHAAGERFSQTGNHLDEDLDWERQALQVNLQIRAADQPPSLDPRRVKLDHWTPFVLYNLGAAHGRSGNYQQARDYYRALADFSLAREPVYRQEHLVLRDKALTGAGYTYLLEQNYPEAIAQFRQVRLDHSDANQALLGYGWAALEAGDYREALKPWQALSQRSLIHAPVQEALLALPYAYEQLNAPGEALRAYDRAEAHLERELAMVAELTQNLSRHHLLAALEQPTENSLVSLAPTGSHNWLTLDRTSVIETESAYLAQLFRQNAFQTRVQALRDLVQQRELLADWRPKLGIYAQLLRDKRDQRRDREQQLERESLLEQTGHLTERRDQLVQRLERVTRERDYMALADQDSWELYTMTQSATQARERLAAAGQDTGDAAQRLRLFRGILLWRSAQEFPARLWQNEKTRRQLDAALEELESRSAQVRRITETDLDIEPSLARIERQLVRLNRQLANLDLALERNLTVLAKQVQSHLAEHGVRLNQYLARARLAAARLQDDALREARP